MLKKIFNNENGDITLLGFDKDECFVSIEFNKCRYDIRYYVDEDGDLALLHNNGFCAATSDFIMCNPNNEDYESDIRLNEILGAVQDKLLTQRFNQNLKSIPNNEKFRVVTKNN